MESVSGPNESQEPDKPGRRPRKRKEPVADGIIPDSCIDTIDQILPEIPQKSSIIRVDSESTSILFYKPSSNLTTLSWAMFSKLI